MSDCKKSSTRRDVVSTRRGIMALVMVLGTILALVGLFLIDWRIGLTGLGGILAFVGYRAS